MPLASSPRAASPSVSLDGCQLDTQPRLGSLMGALAPVHHSPPHFRWPRCCLVVCPRFLSAVHPGPSRLIVTKASYDIFLPSCDEALGHTQAVTYAPLTAPKLCKGAIARALS